MRTGQNSVRAAVQARALVVEDTLLQLITQNQTLIQDTAKYATNAILLLSGSRTYAA